MMLSDADIEQAMKLGAISVGARGDGWLQPAGVDLRLSPLHKVRQGGRWVHAEGDIHLEPGACVLGMTRERVRIGRSHAGQLTGKSGIGRLFVVVHKTAGHIDPGFEGTITLEIKNHFDVPVVLRAGEKVAQLLFFELKTPSRKPYGHAHLGSHYQDQTEPRTSYLESSALLVAPGMESWE